MIQKQQNFPLKSIVFAKVQNYHPWPARIAKKFQQHGKIVYKVNFFGDPTYSYVHSNFLTPFEQFKWEQQSFYVKDWKLQKAIQLAKISYLKKFQDNNESKQQANSYHLKLNKSNKCLKQSNNFLVSQSCFPQKIHEVDQLNQEPFQGKEVNKIQINPQNVLQIIESYKNYDGFCSVENSGRKQLICIQNELKQNLLQKYNLNTVDFLKPTQNNEKYTINNPKQKKIIRKDLKYEKLHRFSPKQLCQRSIKRILLIFGFNPKLSKQLTFKIIQKISRQSSIILIEKDLKVQQNFFRVIYLLIQNLKKDQNRQINKKQNLIQLLNLDQINNKCQEQNLFMTQIKTEEPSKLQ